MSSDIKPLEGGGGSGPLVARVAAVVVTYNRAELLLMCIDRLMAQTVAPLMDIIVVDNASTDGTAERVAGLPAGSVTYLNTGANLGGAGGFQYGIRYAVEAGYGLVWVMDDDCFPTPTALEELLVWDGVLGGDYGFLCSKVLWKDGSLCKMNVPKTSLARKVGLEAVAPAEVIMASFVSSLLRSDVVRKVGLPIKEFFIWSDDLEYTRRVSMARPCYYIPDSVVHHWMARNVGSDVATDSEARLQRYRMAYRNEVYLYRREGVPGVSYQIARLTGHAARVVASGGRLRRERLGTIAGGTLEGLRFRPQIEYCRAPGEPVRVLELFGEPIARGGQESFVLGALSNMDLRGLRVDLCTPYSCDNEKHRAAIRNAGGEVYSLGLSFKPGKSRKSVEEPLRLFFAEHPYDVVHVHSGSVTFLSIAARIAKESGVRKVIVHSHATGYKKGLPRVALREYASLGMRQHADVFLACSEAAGAAKFSRDLQRKMIVVKSGIALDEFRFDANARRRIRERFGISDSAIVLGNVGRFSSEKNHAHMIDVLGAMVDMGENASLLLVGDGDLKPAIEAAANELGLSSRVHFTGGADMVGDYLSAMDLFVFPSFFEGFGMAAVEAQASGLPVLASDRVPESIDFTGNVWFASLEEPAYEWAKRASDLVACRENRVDRRADAARAGFGISDASRLLREMYLS